MDEIDFKISMLLMENSRIPYKEFAEMFHISVNSIHKRIKSLVDLKIIQGFKARLGFANFTNITNIVMFGIPNAKNKKELMDELGRNENIYKIIRASGNMFYIQAYIRNTSELDYLVSYIRKTGDITELKVGIDRNSPIFPSDDKKNLSDTDYLIMYSLKNNSRKNISDIASELNISTKTVSRRLENIIKSHLVQFYLEWYPDNSGQILSIIILKLKTELIINDTEFIDNLKKRYGSKIISTWSFSNLPNIKLIKIWTETMRELQELESSLLSDERYESVEITVLLYGKMYPIWIDKLLDEKIKEIDNESKKDINN
ncbi:MAG: winged helix-turn-helix transcriptional regulator [Promethearchaeota archaeon]|nr:MAG: winged helix-turn-helix transcriptional regulator [Candidatus Lokiarchaeota archaeon]